METSAPPEAREPILSLRGWGVKLRDARVPVRSGVRARASPTLRPCPFQSRPEQLPGAGAWRWPLGQEVGVDADHRTMEGRTAETVGDVMLHRGGEVGAQLPGDQSGAFPRHPSHSSSLTRTPPPRSRPDSACPGSGGTSRCPATSRWHRRSRHPSSRPVVQDPTACFGSAVTPVIRADPGAGRTRHELARNWQDHFVCRRCSAVVEVPRARGGRLVSMPGSPSPPKWKGLGWP